MAVLTNVNVADWPDTIVVDSAPAHCHVQFVPPDGQLVSETETWPGCKPSNSLHSPVWREKVVFRTPEAANENVPSAFACLQTIKLPGGVDGGVQFGGWPLRPELHTALLLT